LQIIFDSLVTSDGNDNSSNKHIWIKKATGLGISEFMLRFMAWVCFKDNALSDSQMCIVTGPRIDLAIALIDRMKRLFAGSSSIKGLISFDTKETVIELNNVKIEAFPSHHLDAMRGLPNVSLILLDEADFFPPGQQQDARDVSERSLEQDPGKIAINPDKFDKLITSLRTAVDNDGTLDKENTSYNDIFDAFRLALKFYHFEERSS
jgi:late competence protein required for DNA uptake (superfamily II DNA/RNA helicase)